MRLREQMPEWDGKLIWMNSHPLKREDLLGDNPTLIHFWSESCSLCKEAMPNINAFRKEYKDRLNVIAVHMPRSENDRDLKKIKKTADAYDITHPLVIDNDYKLTDAFANKYVPAYYVFDHEGKLRHFQAGGRGMTMLRKRIARILGIRTHA